MRKLLLRMILPFMGFAILLVPVSAAAWGPFDSVPCNGEAKSSAVCGDKNGGNPISGANGLIVKIANLISIIAGIAAVIVVIVGGLRYVVANGDSNAINSAKNTILYALVGLVVIALARTLITFVVSRI